MNGERAEDADRDGENRKSANLREILLPFFLQCIWGGGAPSAVQ